MSGLINKVKEAIHSDKDKHNDSHTTGTHTAGTHDTRTSGVPEGTAGPHSSRAANAADPRVDSDLDSSRRTGATGTTGGLGSTGGMTGTHSSGMTGTHSSGLPEGTAGPHSSRAANAADPRVDSDLDSSRRTGGLGGSTYNQTTTGTSGLSSHGAGAHGPTGTHSSGLSGANTGAHMGENTAYGTNNPGPAPKTAGPHKSDMLNKADPRVDSNLDGSKTVGKEKTFETS